MTHEEAALRRAELGRESQFFGAMDGAMKFVQGDAIAGFLIVGVNALGGLGLGISRGLSWQDAVSSFGVLAIGDGLVNCLPSLLTSLAAGFIVTHVHDTRTQSSGGQVFTQFLENSKVIGLCAAAFFVFALLPGFPTAPFAGMGLMLLFLFSYSRSAAAKQHLEILELEPVALPDTGTARKELEQPAGRNEMLPYHGVVRQEVLPLEIELDQSTFQGRWDLSNSASTEGAQFSRYIESQKTLFFRDHGVALPDISFRFASSLTPGGYRIRLHENTVRSGVLRLGEIFVSAPPAVIALFGGGSVQSVRSPADHGLSCWLEPDRSLIQAMSRLGVSILQPVEFLAFDCLAATREHLADLHGIDDVKRDMKMLQQRYPGLYEEVIDRGLLSFPELTEVFRRLLREQVSVRDSRTILEAIAEYAANTPPEKDRGSWLQDLHLHLRKSFRRVLSAQAASPGGRLRAFLLSPEVEEEFRSAVASWVIGQGKPPLDPEIDLRLRESSRLMFLPAIDRGALPVVVLCASEIRVGVNEFLSRLFPSIGWFRTIAFEELHEQVRPDVVGVLSC